jgi:hypothetical protein
MVTRCAALLLLAGATTCAAGCGGSVEPITVAHACPEQPLRGPIGYETEGAGWLIDDFETGTQPSDLQIAKIGVRDGYWVRGVDLYDPTYASGTLVTEKDKTCVARGLWSGHFEAHGFTNWNVNWTAVIRATSSSGAVPYDARAWSGISFWAAFGGDNGPEDFPVPVGVTTMDNAWNGGVCTNLCMDYYGTTVPLAHEWRRFVIRFADLTQAGWGVPQVAMRRDQMVGFILWPKQQFDIWIDDVRFEL